MLYTVIMAGGSGTRFWPESRAAQPKQLLRLVGARSMIQATFDRLENLCPAARRLIVTNRSLRDAIANQLPGFDPSHILGEPCKRDTAPCIGLASVWVAQQDPQGIMLVMPADHVIRNVTAFQDAVAQGVRLVEEDPGRIVTFGIRPTYPSDAFGYIEKGETHASGDQRVHRVARFREKPDRQTATEYLQSGNFFWNAGIFLWRVDTIQAALKEFEPAMAEHLSRIATAWDSPSFAAALDQEFSAIQGKSIDYAVLERYSNVWMVEAPFDWDDVGSWNALPRLNPQDSQGNTVQATHVGIDTSQCVVRGQEGHLIVTLGMHDCIIVQTPEATLIAQRGEEEKLRQVVRELEAKGLTQYL